MIQHIIYQSEWPTLKSLQITNIREGMEKEELSYTVGGKDIHQSEQPLWKEIWRFLKKLKIELLYDPSIPLLGTYPDKTVIKNGTCIPVLVAALFTIAKTWKQMSIQRWMNKENVIHVYNGILFSNKKEWNNVICNNIDGSRHYHTKQRKTPYNLYVESKIWHKWTYLWNRNRLTDIESRIVVAKEKGSGGEINWEFGISICKLLYIEWINIKVLLYSSGNYIQYSVINHNRKQKKKLPVSGSVTLNIISMLTILFFFLSNPYLAWVHVSNVYLTLLHLSMS